MHVQLRLVNGDLDENERQHEALRQEMRWVKQIMMGILISTTTAAIVGTINLLIGGFGN